jgi:hypothetical protein
MNERFVWCWEEKKKKKGEERKGKGVKGEEKGVNMCYFHVVVGVCCCCYGFLVAI